MRTLLLRLRLHRLEREHAADPQSPEYLYLVLQSKRLSLSATIGRFRPATLPVWPLLLAVTVIKTLDLWIANQIVRSLINERDLMDRSRQSRGV
ncbi:hypothetical protein [Telmatospirillum sp.]|uniref:hypothetical protein n=1 Tax=Telmatospirillum sp. TaxID=2079197 RepID=UPI0028442C6B|nr:hypothetical protein [Telmatospirillum sp.]MDR3441147.1 hypothetical protein [Telmatospirillum sp.]